MSLLYRKSVDKCMINILLSCSSATSIANPQKSLFLFSFCLAFQSLTTIPTHLTYFLLVQDTFCLLCCCGTEEEVFTPLSGMSIIIWTCHYLSAYNYLSHICSSVCFFPPHSLELSVHLME